MVHSSTIDQLINLTAGKFPNCSVYVHDGVITRELYESRKAERQNKPDWSKAPAWASCLTQEPDGFWRFFKEAPSAANDISEWVGGKRFSSDGTRGEVIGNWQDTLEQRPEVKSEKPVLAGRAARAKAWDEIQQRMVDSLFGAGSETAKADWYDYENQTVTKLPPISAEFELFPFFHLCEVVAHHDGGAVVCDKKTLEYVHIKWGSFRCRPLDFNRKPEQSPELSFHLATAQNELTSSAKLLPAESSLLQSITGVIAAIQAIREVV